MPVTLHRRYQIGELWQTIKALRRRGLGGPVDQALVESAGALWDGVKAALKKNRNAHRFTLDEQQGWRYIPPQTLAKGEQAMPDFIAYYRVSTKAQGASGLGLDAQRQAVEAFARQGGAKVSKTFTEIESGGKTAQDRPQLAAALAFAKRAGATLIVAKLDRLARNVHFLSGLMESGVDFLAVDNPAANRLTVHIMAAMAEYEREAISARTKAALAQAKARGAKLGSRRPGHWRGREEARLRGALKGAKRAAEVRARAAREEYADILPAIRDMRAKDLSLQKIADALNAEGHKTRRGASFTAATIHGILKRAD